MARCEFFWFLFARWRIFKRVLNFLVFHYFLLDKIYVQYFRCCYLSFSLKILPRGYLILKIHFHHEKKTMLSFSLTLFYLCKQNTVTPSFSSHRQTHASQPFPKRLVSFLPLSLIDPLSLSLITLLSISLSC